FVAQQLRLAVVDQQDIHLVGGVHRVVDSIHRCEFSDAATCAAPTTADPRSRASRDNRTLPPRGTSHGLPSSPWPSAPEWAGGGNRGSYGSPGWFRSRPF